MKKGMSLSGIFVAVIVLGLLAGSLAADERTDKVDKLFAEWDTTVSPGCALAVIKDGLIVKFRNAPKDPLVAKAPDKFSHGHFNVEFVRKGKKVTGFELSVGRAGHIVFLKK